jgi:type VI secretion system protein ImpB
MPKEGSVAPPERVNIRYKPAVGDAQEEVELPLKLLFLGDYVGRPDARPLEERTPINVDKGNFEQVLAEQNLGLTLSVPEVLSGEAGNSLPVALRFQRLGDFGPEAVAKQVPELRQLLELREALASLKNPLSNRPAFRKKIQELLSDPARRSQLMRELGLGDEKEGGR